MTTHGATPTSVAQTRAARYSVLSLDPAGAAHADAPVAVGVLLEDPASNRVHLRLRRDWEEIDPEEADTLAELERSLEATASDMGAAAFFDTLESSLSNNLRVTDRRETIVEDFARGLNRLYRQHVESVVQAWRTHVPRYSLAAAAGMFRDNNEIEELGWEEVPAGTRLSKDMFAAEIVGHSMEPTIPDGSLCLFRSNTAGSRQNKLVLVEARGAGSNDRYTVKRYRSAKSASEEGTWAQERIRLESLNPDYPSWDLDPTEDRYRVIAEFVEVIG